MNKNIKIKGASVHNLKNVDLEIPRDKMVIITGVSGSGKSSLAFDTIFAEGQRRYVESLSAYARQFLGVMDKPEVESITNLSPAISIEQRKLSRNPRSTVGTVTEIYDYLRVLFARVGTPFCYNCGRKITSQTVDEIVELILKKPSNSRLLILAPIMRGKKGTFTQEFKRIGEKGYVRVVVDGKMVEIEKVVELDKNKKHDIEIVVDRIKPNKKIRSRITDSVEAALNETGGLLKVRNINIDDLKKRDEIFSTQFACPYCGISYPEISPRLFSFNSPYGACKRCQGIGTEMEVDPGSIIFNEELSILEGAITPIGEPRGRFGREIERMSSVCDVQIERPWKELTKYEKEIILYGKEFWEGIVPYLDRRYRETESDWIRSEIEKYMVVQPCFECGGARLSKEALSVRIKKKNIYQVVQMNIVQAKSFMENLKFSDQRQEIARELISEVLHRLRFLVDVGVDYLTLDRPTKTLAGGEAQRVHLATQIGSGLMGIIYILDEPTIGLHERDILRLIDTLKSLRDIGNTVIIVEHDPKSILAADWVIDLGPGAGIEGGEVVFTGKPKDLCKYSYSITGRYLSGKERIPVPERRRDGSKKSLRILGAAGNNLKMIDIDIPLNRFVCLTGVSGSGKSTLLIDTLYRALARKFHGSRYLPLEHTRILGIENIDKVINIDQSPIGRTPRSNPATYTGIFTPIREFYAELPESRVRGFNKGRFSFNVIGGRCEACRGEGLKKIEMHFLADVYITCEVCKGKRFKKETLEVEYKGKNIAEVLDMTVLEAVEFFSKIPQAKRKLELLRDVGLGYIKLGQPATTLSGGEAQRIKLAKELSKVATGDTLYLLDEPTTGLHAYDIRLLLEVLDRLVGKGNTVVVIEHNLDVIKHADWIIDLGPEGGEEGGEIVATGTPEDVAQVPQSYTGQFLREALGIVG
ncbi:MAG: excinuclease ABC subunit UvrA [Candidatus Stahlbacteria bacterium]|nr:MAG: excinuclease ABC subunit UvrA [Candidatus Stahlbacteria bacterium]